jgi:hypothetical protein
VLNFLHLKFSAVFVEICCSVKESLCFSFCNVISLYLLIQHQVRGICSIRLNVFWKCAFTKFLFCVCIMCTCRLQVACNWLHVSGYGRSCHSPVIFTWPTMLWEKWLLWLWNGCRLCSREVEMNVHHALMCKLCHMFIYFFFLMFINMFLDLNFVLNM